MPEYPRKFIHKGEDHMSFKGFFLTAQTYYYHKNNNVPIEVIFMEHGTEYDTIFKERAKKLERWHQSFPRIRNMQEHYEYILNNFVTFEDAVKLREKMEGKTDEEIIHMMPVAFAWILSIHLLQQKRQGRGSFKTNWEKSAEEIRDVMEFDDESDPLDIL